MPDSEEGIPPYYFDVNNRDTYNLAAIDPCYAKYGDAEFLCRVAEQSPGAVDSSKDWSDTNGKNWNK